MTLIGLFILGMMAVVYLELADGIVYQLLARIVEPIVVLLGAILLFQYIIS